MWFSLQCSCPSPPSPMPPSRPPQPPAYDCTATSGSGSGTSTKVYQSNFSPYSPPTATLSISGTSITIIFPGEGPIGWSIYANDTTQPDGSSGVDAWVNGVCTSGNIEAKTLGLPNVPNSASSGTGVTFSLADLGIYPQCDGVSPLPRYIVFAIIAQYAVSGASACADGVSAVHSRRGNQPHVSEWTVRKSAGRTYPLLSFARV